MLRLSQIRSEQDQRATFRTRVTGETLLKFAADIMTLKKKDLLLVVDYYSEYVELLSPARQDSRFSHHSLEADIRQTCKAFPRNLSEMTCLPSAMASPNERYKQSSSSTQVPSRRIGSLSRSPQV